MPEAVTRLGGRVVYHHLAMRPGKPNLGAVMPGGVGVLSLPGNPVSTAVCALVFLAPAIRKLGGGTYQQQLFFATITSDLPENDQRQDYMRASLESGDDGLTMVRPAHRQDSSMMATLAHANAFIVRPPFDPPLTPGDTVTILPMPRLF